MHDISEEVAENILSKRCFVTHIHDENQIMRYQYVRICSIWFCRFGFILLGIYLYKKYTTGCTQRVIGQIARNTSHYHYGASTSSMRNKNYTTYYEYDYEGNHYVVKAHTNFDSTETDGGIELFIDPSNPERHYRKADLKATLLFSGLGLAMLIILFYVYFTAVY